MKYARVVLLLLFAACARDDAPSAGSDYEIVATGLYVPWAIAFADDGRMFVTERPGRIRVIEQGRLLPEPWAVVPTTVTGEAGLMGIAIAGSFVYVAATYHDGSGLFNRIIRYRDVDGKSSDPHTLIDGLPAAEFHAGTALSFGPDGALYVTTGDAGNPEAAQDAQSLNGKILRITRGGQIEVFALGVRNPQGLAWSREGQLFATDHGPSGFPRERFRRNHDELNAIIGGKNYGWPHEAGASDDARYVSPLADWTPGIAPAGLAIHGRNVYVGGLRGRQLRRLTLERTRTGWRVTRQEVLFEERLGRIRAVAMGPDGYLYFSTSNRDGRGDPAAGDDRILRLIPK